MSLELFSRLLEQSDISDRGRQWFPIWVERYGVFTDTSRKQRLPLDRSLIIEFLRSLRDAGVPASNRLRVVLALECYRDVVLCVEVPSLKDIAKKLVEIAERESHVVELPVVTDSKIEQFARLIDPTEPEVIQQLRRECRLLHYSLRTEKAYAGWVARFLKRYDIDRPESFAAIGSAEVKEFLSELAIQGHVAASTQNQAFSRQVRFCTLYSVAGMLPTP